MLKEPTEMNAILVKKPEKFHHICESYVLGIVCYGSYFPLGPFIHDHKKIKQQTLVIINLISVKIVESDVQAQGTVQDRRE